MSPHGGKGYYFFKYGYTFTWTRPAETTVQSTNFESFFWMKTSKESHQFESHFIAEAMSAANEKLKGWIVKRRIQQQTWAFSDYNAANLTRGKSGYRPKGSEMPRDSPVNGEQDQRDDPETTSKLSKAVRLRGPDDSEEDK